MERCLKKKKKKKKKKNTKILICAIFKGENLRHDHVQIYG